MFLNFLSFEIKLRLRAISTYVYFALFFFITLFSVSSEDFGPVGNGRVLLNGPWALTVYAVQMTVFGIFVISAIFGTSILRDFKEDTYQLIFTKPITKFDYLGGRWAGSFVITLAIFLSIPLGAMFGSLMPWADKTRIAPINLWFHLQPYLSISAVQIFFLGSLFFCVAALTRRLIIVYLQGVVLFAIYLIGAIFVFTARQLDTFWPSLFDPFGLILYSTTTRYWTVVEKNTLLLSWTGVFLYNRLLWTALGIAALAITWVFFPLSAEALTAKRGSKARRSKATDDEESVQRVRGIAFPRITGTFSFRTAIAQLVTLTQLRFRNIVREIPFWAIVLLMTIIAGINARQVGRTRDTAVWPVTYLMVEVLQGAFLFLLVVATLYAGELIWRERDVHFEQIHDSLPTRSWINFLSQFFSLALVELVMLVIVMVCGIVCQASLGYFHFELGLYFKELFLISYPNLLSYVLVALFVHTMVSNKFIGHGIVIGLNILLIIMARFGLENRLYQIGAVAPYTYSDMNGYGHFVPAIFWSLVYWCAFAAILGVVSIAFARRGADLSWSSRLQNARQRWPGLQPGFVAFLLIFIGSGAWYYYNAHVLNQYRNAKDTRHLQADYEKHYKKYEKLPQPKVTAVDVSVDILPEQRSFRASGHYTLQNNTGQPVRELHLSNSRESIDEIRFDRPAQKQTDDKRLGYMIYKLDPPLAPGDSLRLDFRASHLSRGFRDGNELAEFAYNGTFFDRDFFPMVGYNRGVEIDDPVRRREEGLAALEELAPRADPYYKNLNLFVPDSEWVTFHAVVSTSPDQIAVAPGYLKREWTDKGRRYFEYSMGDTRINDFFSFLSGRYALKRDSTNGVNLEIYYQPGHEYNLNRMLDSSKKGLAYYGNAFAPYQFTQFRILEYPRYRTFAQSFPNTVPYSEALGFIQRVQKPDDIDMVFYITAHELGHQWWGHQVVGSLTEGSNMMSESLAQYSALMIMEKEFGPENIRKFLKHELDSYLRGRGAERRREHPLALVQNEAYVWYNKGSLIMYALRDYLGEDRLNAALHKFLIDKRYATGPYPNTLEFTQYLRDAAPPEMKYLIDDMFNSIILFDNKLVSATWTETSDKKYKVRLNIEAHKLKADGLGAEKEVALNDLIDIGVFTGETNHEKPLYLQKHRLTSNKSTIEVIVNQKPTRAGIDPYNKLIDRKPDDNMGNVNKP